MANHPFKLNDLVAIYLRDSGGDEQELSVDQQERVIKEWANINGVVVSKVFSDSSSGTTTAGRTNFLKMIGYFQHEPAEAGIVVWRSNRFGRNIDDTQYFKADLRRRGYIVHSITDNIPEGPMGRLIEFALDWKDEVFSAQLSEDVKRGLGDLVRVYGAVPGVPPRGFIREPITIGRRRSGEPHIVHKWKPDPDLIPIIQRAFEMRARGATLKSIQEETKLYKSVNGWCTFFANKIYKGILEFSDLTIENYCSPIVSNELWDAANLTGQKRRYDTQTISQARRMGSSFLLSGLLRCKKCGALMNGYSVKQWRYYACSRHKTHFDCDALVVRVEPLDDAIMDAFINHILSVDNLQLVQSRLVEQYALAQEENQSRRDDLNKRSGLINKSINNLMADIAQNGPSDSIGRMLREFEVEKKEVHQKLSELEKSMTPPAALSTASLDDIAEKIKSILLVAEVEQKRYYLQAFVKQISVVKDLDAVRGSIQYYPPF